MARSGSQPRLPRSSSRTEWSSASGPAPRSRSCCRLWRDVGSTCGASRRRRRRRRRRVSSASRWRRSQASTRRRVSTSRSTAQTRWPRTAGSSRAPAPRTPARRPSPRLPTASSSSSTRASSSSGSARRSRSSSPSSGSRQRSIGWGRSRSGTPCAARMEASSPTSPLRSTIRVSSRTGSPPSPGVVEHGLFPPELVSDVVVATGESVEIRRR